MGEKEKVALLGTDNRNVLAWASHGFAKQGIALTLNQETATWIAKRHLVVESFYLRSGRNFSEDWMSRIDLGNVIRWGRANNFRRIRFQTGRNDFVADWKTNQREGWGPGPVLVQRRTPRFSGKCVEWNSAGGGLGRASMEMKSPWSMFTRCTLEW